MKTIFFISPNGFPSKNNRNVGIFTLEQATALKKNYTTDPASFTKLERNFNSKKAI
jgi:hypothetical protein